MNKSVKTWIGVVIIIIMAITAGIFVWEYYSLNPIPEYNPQIVETQKPIIKNDVSIANPASFFCEQNGGKLEIITAEDGSQSGMCKFSDGSECEEWKFQRGECKIGDSLKQVDTSDWQTYRNGKYGFEIKYPKDWSTRYRGESIAFSSLESDKFLNDAIKNGITADIPSDLYVTYFDNFKKLQESNSEASKFANLDEYLQKSSYFKNTKQIDINGKRGWFVNNNNAMFEYGSVFIENRSAIFKIDLMNELLYDMENEVMVISKMGQKFLSTFKFIN